MRNQEKGDRTVIRVKDLVKRLGEPSSDFSKGAAPVKDRTVRGTMKTEVFISALTVKMMIIIY